MVCRTHTVERTKQKRQLDSFQNSKTSIYGTDDTAMIKILEIDGVAVYQTQKWIIKKPTFISQISFDWLETAFTPAQLRFLEKRHAVLRPHPKHNPTLELFIDETTLDKRDWTALHLLF